MTETLKFTHFNSEGRANMVAVSEKPDSYRQAIACGMVNMGIETIKRLKEGGHKKGDVLAVAQIAAIMGAKKTSDLIPMCHPIFLTGVDVTFQVKEQAIYIEASVHTVGKTGVEMEALTAVSIAALTIYDMCKAVDKEMQINDVKLLYKTGGQSGTYTKEGYNG